LVEKNLLNSTSAEEKRKMLDREEKGITVKKQAELLEVNRTSVYYRPVQKPDPDIEIMHLIDEIYTKWPITDTEG